MKFLLLILSFLALGCPFGSVGLGYLAMGWKPDGSGIVAILKESGLGSLVVSYDVNGEETKRVFIAPSAIQDPFFDKLFFASDGKRIFANVEDDIYLIDPETGNQEQLIESHQLVAVSLSGKLLLAQSQIVDSGFLSIFSLSGNTPRVIRSISFAINPKYISKPIRENYLFIGDSMLVMRDYDSGKFLLAFYDTLLIRKSIGSDAAASGIHPAFASQVNKLLFFAEAGFTLYDFADNTTAIVMEGPKMILAQRTPPDASFILYTVSERSVYENSLRIIDTKTRIVVDLASNMHSSGHLSPDGKLAAFFTRSQSVDGDPVLNILTVP